jgi:hypothetical protein
MIRGKLCTTWFVVGTLVLCRGASQAEPLPGVSDEKITNTNASAGVAPPDVYTRLMVLHADLEKIRIEMGMPPPEPYRLEISGVAPREVYFQASTLLRKSNRLSFEHTRDIATPPPPPDDTIRPADVLTLVESAIDRITQVKAQLGIEEVSPEQPPDSTKTPTDVLYAALAASRQVNLLLDRPFSPAEVYQQLTHAIGYAARLRAQFPGNRIPELPPFERGMRPSDVMHKLVECLGSIERIAARSDLSMLKFNGEMRDGVTPNDVYDMATLLVSELDYLWSHAEDAVSPRPAYYPGRKIPSDVYQRASLLERQLVELERLVEKTPNWLSRN